ncbi:MAG: prepilin-type N-terminal cleavage/methylation domain-containing protein [Candidatus Cloacimonetes bacterium]|nr:prepilin-type N-terminal cleavage/methylation domain-containing protein [Candidatus Cloacimonadota bacterium]
MRSSMFNQRGFSLAELMLSTVLMSLLAYGFALAMLQFVIGFQETRDYISLQKDMLNVMNLIRQGTPIDGIHTSLWSDHPLIGLLTAQKVTFSYNNDAMTMSPVRGSDPLNRMWVRIKHERNTGRVLMDYQFQNLSKFNEVIFPTDKEKIGRDNRFRITRLDFTNLTPHLEQPDLISIYMVGEVRYRVRGRISKNKLMSQEDDLQMNVQRLILQTTVFVSNADKFDT